MEIEMGRIKNPARRQQLIFAACVILPLIVFYLIFLIWPILWAFRISLTDWNLFTNEANFVGLKNFLRAFKDPVFRVSLRNTFLYALLSVPSGLILAVILGVMIQAAGRWRSIFRVLFFFPVVTSEIATGVLWRWLYNPEYGLFNSILRLLHLPTQDWLLSPDLALICVVIYATWKGIGFLIIIVMAGLDGIEQSYYEAARVDGANGRQLFRHITIPLLRPTFILITGVIGSLQVFGPIYVMTQGPGGPVNSTRTLVLYQYETAFLSFQWPYGVAIAFISFAIILFFTVLQLRVLRQRWET
jgi:multiple sugar transport system permease protein